MAEGLRARPLRWQLFVHFAGLSATLAVLSACVGWWWMDAAIEAQARESARSIARVVSAGGFSLNAQVSARMTALTGYRFTLDPQGPAPPGAVTISEDGVRIQVVDLHNRAAAARLRVLPIATAVAAGGLLLAILLAWYLARRYAAPLEALTTAARRLGTGDWETAVPAQAGSRELATLATDLEQMRGQLALLSQQQRQSERLSTLGTFTATIAHEIRNPLAAIKLTLQVVARRIGGTAGIDELLAEIERLELIVDELLGYARGMDVSLAPCDLAVVADDVCRLLARQARHAGVTLSQEGAARVQGDARRLRQLLLNLVLNAIQVQHGGGTVRIQLRADGLRVFDAGPGIDPALRARLFEPFVSERPEGTGLGLHIAHQIAQAHAAELRVEAGAPGAIFTLAGLKPA